MLDQIVVEPHVNGAGTYPAPAVDATSEPVTGAGRVTWEPPLRLWLDRFFEATRSPDAAAVKLHLASSFKRQYLFTGFADGERYEVQVVEPDIKDPKRKYHEQSCKFGYSETLKGGCELLHQAGQAFGYQGLYLIPQVVNPASLSKASPDAWHMPAKGAGTDAKDISAFLISYADFDTVREGGAKKVSATHAELMVSCERGIEFYVDAANILGSTGALAFLFSGNGCQVHVALDRLPHDPTDNGKNCQVQKLRVEFVRIVNVLYSCPVSDAFVEPKRAQAPEFVVRSVRLLRVVRVRHVGRQAEPQILLLHTVEGGSLPGAGVPGRAQGRCRGYPGLRDAAHRRSACEDQADHS